MNEVCWLKESSACRITEKAWFTTACHSPDDMSLAASCRLMRWMKNIVRFSTMPQLEAV
jgi:hypothetical protein